MKKHIFILIVFFTTAFYSFIAQSAGDPIKGKTHYTTCVACHGQNGEGLQTTSSPRLSGLRASYLVRQLQIFGSGVRGGNPKDTLGLQMSAMAKVLPDDQAVEDVAAYIATLKSDNPSRTETTGDPRRGSEEYLQCTSCHGSSGQGFKGRKGSTPIYDSPRLAGQHDWYIIRQLVNFRDGIRGQAEDKPGNYMASRAKPLRDDQTIKDIAAYLSTLK